VLYEIHAFSGSDFVHDFSQRRPQRLDRPITFTAKHGFDFAEQQLDRIEIRRIGWQVTDFRLGGFDCFGNSVNFVCREIVQNHDIVGTQLGAEVLLNPIQEYLSVDWTIDYHWSHDSFAAKPHQYRRG
jgi:hypothetical protein